MDKKAKAIIDCRTEEGITVGLIDSLISISRVLKRRLKAHQEESSERYRKDEPDNYYLSEGIIEALKDLHSDEDLLIILQTGAFNPNILNEENKRLMGMISKAGDLLKEKKVI